MFKYIPPDGCEATTSAAILFCCHLSTVLKVNIVSSTISQPIKLFVARLVHVFTNYINFYSIDLKGNVYDMAARF